VQLQEHLESFRAAGIGVVAMTYDAEPLQQDFVDRFGIGYPLLSDVEAESVRALGILNTDHEPGDAAYGIPYPGAFILDPDMRIRGKVFVEAYEQRVDAAGTLAAAREALELQ
jgi:peroxiredoxin